MNQEADPASPRFAADEPRVVATPFGTLDDEHPLRRAFGRIDYPASARRVLDAVRNARDIDQEQARWLAGVLPAGATFDGPEEVVAALGRWGLPPPSAPTSL